MHAEGYILKQFHVDSGSWLDTFSSECGGAVLLEMCCRSNSITFDVIGYFYYLMRSSAIMLRPKVITYTYIVNVICYVICLYSYV